MSSSRVRKYSEGLPQKTGPLKATLPITSILRGPLQQNATGSTLSSLNYNNLLPAALSPPMRHISPDCSLYAGHRSPNANDFHGAEAGIRRTASLDTLYTRPTWSLGHVSTVLHLDKSTQTDESYVEKQKSTAEWNRGGSDTGASSSPDIKIEKVIRQRWQRVQRGEHSVSSQTLSPAHGSASPVMIPQHHLHSNTQAHIRPMRSSVEGLNQEIEKLVLFTGPGHSCRPELGLYSRGTPEGHRAPLAELFHSDMRSVNTQTPIGDILSSDDSHSTSPEDAASMANASPRINRFLAREPPDGCEKVNSKLTETDQSVATHFKPCVGFQLRPSLGSAFQPLQPVAVSAKAVNPDVVANTAAEAGDANEQ